MTKELQCYEVKCIHASSRDREFYTQITALGITPDHFLDKANSILFKCIENAYKKDNCTKIDFDVLVARAQDQVTQTVQPSQISLTSMAVNSTVNECRSITSSDFTEHVEAAVEKMKTAYSKMIIAEKLEKMRVEISLPSSNPSKTLAEIAALQSDIVRSMDFNSKSSTIFEMKDEIIDSITGDYDPPITSGFPTLDNMLHGGLQPSYLIYVAGRPGMAKTQVLVNMAARGAKELNLKRPDKKVMFLTYELPKPFIAKRMLASESNLTLSQLIGGPGNKDKVSAEELEELKRCIDSFNKNIILVNAMSMNVSESAAFVENAVRTQGVCAAYFDYVQIMRTHDNKIPEKEGDIASISFVLRELAANCNIPVIAAAQLNRDVEKRKDKRPKLSDLRSSGALENDARVVLGLYRDEYYNPNTDHQNILELGILKNTNGGTKTFNTFFNPTKCSIYELEEEDESGDAFGDI